jgi:hypothetical protein
VGLMVIPDEGKTLWLDRMMNLVDVDPTGLEVVLYSNNYTPVDLSVLADFVPASFTDSDPIPIPWSSWPVSIIVAHQAVTGIASPPTWTCTAGGPETVYGWVLYGATTEKAYAAQRFDNPRCMAPGARESLDPFLMRLQTLH